MIRHTIVRTGGATLLLLTAGFMIGFMLRPAAVDPAHDHLAAHYAKQDTDPASVGRVTSNPDLPPDDADAAARLAASPRHSEWVDVTTGNGAAIRTFVVHPERSTNAPVVIVVHDAFRDIMGPWIRSVADQLARDGFIALVPDMLSGKGPNGGGTDSLGAEAVPTLRVLMDEELTSTLNAVAAYARTIRSSNGKVATLGFCWGGGVSFTYALTASALDAAVSFYGPMPTAPSAYANAKAPILGLYGGNDNRVNVNIPAVTAEFRKRGVSYTPVIYDGAGHGFLRLQGGALGANGRASEQAWPRAIAFLRQHLERPS